MIEKTLEELESKIRGAKSLAEVQRKELTGLVANLKKEVIELSATHNEEAGSVVRFTKVSADEALREKKNRKLLDLSLQGTRAAVEDFETSHPSLVGIVNDICTFLARAGV